MWRYSDGTIHFDGLSVRLTVCLSANLSFWLSAHLSIDALSVEHSLAACKMLLNGTLCFPPFFENAFFVITFLTKAHRMMILVSRTMFWGSRSRMAPILLMVDQSICLLICWSICYSVCSVSVIGQNSTEHTGPEQHWAITGPEQLQGLLVLNRTGPLLVLNSTGPWLILNSTGLLLVLDSTKPLLVLNCSHYWSWTVLGH